MNPLTVITGGAGFIGSHLAQRLRSLGHELLLIDDLSTGRRSNLRGMLDHRCRLHVAPVSQAAADPALAPDWRRTRFIYHLAASVGVRLVVERPADCIRNNIDETAAVLDAARPAGAAVLIASSSEVYGKNPDLPLAENADLHFGPTSAPRWSYALSKALDEHLALAHHHATGLGVVVARLFNTIGPRQVGHYGMVVPRFVADACAGRALSVYGDGRQTRCFCDVRDTVRALVALLESPEHHGRVFNVGSDHELTINQLADRVLALTGSPAGKRHLPYEQAYGPGFEDPPRRVPDLSRLRHAIGFANEYPLEQTLRELIELERSAPAEPDEDSP